MKAMESHSGRRRRWSALCALLWFISAGPEAAPPKRPGIAIQGVRTWSAPDNTRVVFDLSGPTRYRVFTIRGPQRVVVDLIGARLPKTLTVPQAQDHFLRGIRHGRHGADLRLVLDLKDKVVPKGFLVAPEGPYGHRLVVDLIGTAPPAPPRVAPPHARRPGQRDLIIAIDAGHGGEDPGAVGASGAQEKQVTLAIARRLARLCNREPGMRAVLIRDGDYFIPLRDRVKRARAQKADLFVSIHADAFPDSRAGGSSVYVLSRHGASSEAARWLAERENAADLVGGVSLEDKEESLKAILIDLSQNGSLEASLDVGGRVLRRLTGLGRVHHTAVQRAAFAVLKSPDIPSILVETAFITNPEEERKLADPVHQERLALGVLDGLRAYFLETAPPGTLLAEMGETSPRRTHMLPEVAINPIAAGKVVERPASPRTPRSIP
ncbi:MAG: N-acetylmuramoyl-L-alanine amidase [Beggiatoa sp.]|nr:N-acetylmuramoyl-L-alanine amidase [Beggiatoa sp.]